MKELTKEQYKEIGDHLFVAIEDDGSLLGQRVRMGRAAYAASFPYAVAEALAELTREEIDKLPCPWAEGSWANINMRDAFRNRRRALTAPPDPLRKALSRWVSDGDMDEAIAAVRSADGAK